MRNDYDYDAQLGARIADARNAAGLTQTQLGTRMSLTRSSIANIEAGRQRILANAVIRFGETLGIDPRWLLTGDAYAPPPRPPVRALVSQADRDQIQRGMSVLKSVASVLERLARGLPGEDTPRPPGQPVG